MTLDQTLQQALEHHQNGRLTQAEQLYRQVLAIDPRQADALHLLGVLAQQVGKLDVAVQLISRAIAIRPDAVYHTNLAEALRRAGRKQEAEAVCRRAIEIAPTFPTAYINLGVILQELQRPEEAMNILQRAIDIDPKNAQAWTNLGNARLAIGDLKGAVEMGRKAVEAQPDYSVAHNNLAAALEKQDFLKEAEDEYRKAVELQPDFAEALNNLGSVIRRQGDLRTAMHWWQKSVDARYEYGEAHWNLALAALALGEFEEGWKNYEWRFKCDHSRAYWREYLVPRWTGFDISGKTILLYPEQGFGDVIQFGRFIPQVAARGAKVILQCHKELIELMKSAEGVSQVISEHDQPPPFDTYLPLLSVPWVLGVSFESLPGKIPYIKVDPARREHWTPRIKNEPGRLKVGLVYWGRPTPDPKRSCQFKEFAPLAEVEGVQYFSLQKGPAVEQLKDAPADMKLINLDPELHDFADTAAALEALDLLISIDTAAAHLAGAIGKQTWVLIPYACDFRWMVEREDCPWYPNMRLFRQKKMDEWGEVMLRIRDELKKLL
jgi:tetratricopeptide (TPR) repeat protein